MSICFCLIIKYMKFYNTDTCKLTFGDSIVLVLFNQDSLTVLNSLNSNCSLVCSLVVIKNR